MYNFTDSSICGTNPDIVTSCPLLCRSPVWVLSMAVVDGQGRQQPSLVLRFILCLIVPAYHTLQAEMGCYKYFSFANIFWFLI